MLRLLQGISPSRQSCTVFCNLLVFKVNFQAFGSTYWLPAAAYSIHSHLPLHRRLLHPPAEVAPCRDDKWPTYHGFLALSLEDKQCHISGRQSPAVTAEARVRARVNQCGISGGHSVTGASFSLSSSVFLCQYHSTVALQTHIIWGIRNRLT
jgi:hypothetical protein